MPTGRLVETTAAEDVDNDGHKEKSIIVYDGFGRPVLARNSIGVEAKTVLDPVGQPVLSETHGHPGGITPGAGDTSQNVLLASSEILYDELGRPFETRALQTTVPTVTYQRAPVFKNLWATSYAFYHPNGLVKQINEADGDKVFFEYDGLDRLLKSIDGVGNETILKYDDNHNVVEIREDDKDTQTGQTETYITEQMYDAANRVVERLVPGKLTYRNVYDSRSLLRATSDPEGPMVGSTNSHGNLRSRSCMELRTTLQTRASTPRPYGATVLEPCTGRDKFGEEFIGGELGFDGPIFYAFPYAGKGDMPAASRGNMAQQGRWDRTRKTYRRQ